MQILIKDMQSKLVSNETRITLLIALTLLS
jgi:hypothetical protein